MARFPWGTSSDHEMQSYYDWLTVAHNADGSLKASGATASVADGGTITHGLGSTPRVVLANPVTAGEFVSITAKDGTTFTVAIKKHDNTAGTTQTIYWLAIA